MQRFASLDDDDSPSPVDGTRSPVDSGAQPLNPAGFEDPRGWVDDLKVNGSNSPLPEGGPGKWHESGLHGTDSVIDGKPVDLSEASGDAASASLAQMLEGDVRVASEAPQPSGHGKAVLIGLLVAIGLLAAGGVAAYLLGWIP
jgi:hypothetical protein